MATIKNAINARERAAAKAKVPQLQYVCVDKHNRSTVGSSPTAAWEKYDDECGGNNISQCRFFLLGEEFTGVSLVQLTPVSVTK